MTREFHDLSEALLNHESGGTTLWGNLGYWATAHTYPEACAALADELGSRLQLGPDTRLIEVGFGCGDALLHWMRTYGVQTLAGLNLSQSQTCHAQARLTAEGHAEIASRLHVGSVIELQDFAGSLPWSATAIAALDCAYHFPSRERFLDDAAALLPVGGRVGVTDLLLARPPRGIEHVVLRVICRLARIPRDHLVTEPELRQQWQRAGFEVTYLHDLSAGVMRPFGNWLDGYRCQFSRDGRGPQWRKYRATAAVLHWADARDLLRYAVCVGRRAPPEPTTAAASPHAG
jgi:cyclopropane fatty-acyl-phospholipid synthase-like methyltransferase